jgi:hypothetical protein
MHENDAAKVILANVSVTRVDIARAKTWILSREDLPSQYVGGLLDDWLTDNKIHRPKKVNLAAVDVEKSLSDAARVFSLSLAFYQAIRELVSIAELLVDGSGATWYAQIEYESHGRGGGIPLQISCPFPNKLVKAPHVSEVTSDPDIFLAGIACSTLHPGIHDGIEQSLDCFRRGLYMPSLAMLAAAVEACWTECGAAVAINTGDSHLNKTIANPYAHISKIVNDTRAALQSGHSKALLKNAGKVVSNVSEAELWTTVLRDRRNALH